MDVISLQNLSKTYSGGKQAVRQISLSLKQGEVFGFLGPNGAGKTTTVKLLNGMLAPSAGSCRVLGLDPAGVPEKVHALSGVVTEHAQMYDNLSGMQNLLFTPPSLAFLVLRRKNVPILYCGNWSWKKPGTAGCPPIQRVCGRGSLWPER